MNFKRMKILKELVAIKNTELERDARRYRWLRDQCQYAPCDDILQDAKRLDTFCDTGMVEEEEEEDEDKLAQRRD